MAGLWAGAAALRPGRRDAGGRRLQDADGLRDVTARIAELIDLFAGADSLLERTLDQPLSRAALGFGGVESPSDDE